MSLADYEYELPENLVAQYPPAERGASRLLVVDRRDGTLHHHAFAEFGRFLTPEDLLVLNNTRVIPARLRLPDRNAEIFLLERQSTHRWRCLVRPGRWFSVGRRFELPGVAGEVIAVLTNGERLIDFDEPVDLAATGEMPLPPYIRRKASLTDRERYQTVYASVDGAVAAPTAGLHFTHEALAGLRHVFVTLHVGPGTFQPVKTEALDAHEMHVEPFHVTPNAAAAINEAASVLAVGTTSVRVLETLMARHAKIQPGRGETSLFIRPPFRFQRVNKLLTNFHLPKSTLLMLVAAFAGRELTMEAYREAVRERYRFFSYGDCMLIL
ncbi:MAG TPA: tRNA preQ1(34) S-adenosylmethionine ribosyltransferase-isomerase QueA [Chthoniobacterales bacterium]